MRGSFPFPCGTHGAQYALPLPPSSIQSPRDKLSGSEQWQDVSCKGSRRDSGEFMDVSCKGSRKGSGDFPDISCKGSRKGSGDFMDVSCKGSRKGSGDFMDVSCKGSRKGSGDFMDVSCKGSRKGSGDLKSSLGSGQLKGLAPLPSVVGSLKGPFGSGQWPHPSLMDSQPGSGVHPTFVDSQTGSGQWDSALGFRRRGRGRGRSPVKHLDGTSSAGSEDDPESPARPPRAGPYDGGSSEGSEEGAMLPEAAEEPIRLQVIPHAVSLLQCAVSSGHQPTVLHIIDLYNMLYPQVCPAPQPPPEFC